MKCGAAEPSRKECQSLVLEDLGYGRTLRVLCGALAQMCIGDMKYRPSSACASRCKLGDLSVCIAFECDRCEAGLTICRRCAAGELSASAYTNANSTVVSQAHPNAEALVKRTDGPASAITAPASWTRNFAVVSASRGLRESVETADDVVTDHCLGGALAAL